MPGTKLMVADGEGTKRGRGNKRTKGPDGSRSGVGRESGVREGVGWGVGELSDPEASAAYAAVNTDGREQGLSAIVVLGLFFQGFSHFRPSFAWPSHRESPRPPLERNTLRTFLRASRARSL